MPAPYPDVPSLSLPSHAKKVTRTACASSLSHQLNGRDQAARNSAAIREVSPENSHAVETLRESWMVPLTRTPLGMMHSVWAAAECTRSGVLSVCQVPGLPRKGVPKKSQVEVLLRRRHPIIS